jgi:hypothetical protein
MDKYKDLVDLVINSELKGHPRHEILLSLGDTPLPLIQNAEFPDLKLIMTGDVISKACFDHGISTSILKELPAILAEPKAIFSSATLPDSSVVLTFHFKNGSPIIVPVHKNQPVGRGHRVNRVASVYAKEGPDPVIKWTADGLLIWEK